MTDEGKKAQLVERYHRAAHRVQTAIGFMPNHENQQVKHMRTGIDMSKSDMGGLARLLIQKGVMTELEYLEAVAEAAEREAAAYENELSVRYGRNVQTL